MNGGYDLSTLISVLKTDVKELINTKFELLKLEAYEKISAIGSSLLLGLILINLVFFVFLFAFVTLGFLLSDVVDTFVGGFGLVTLIYLILAGIVLLFRKPILCYFRNFFLKELDSDLEDEVKYQAKQARAWKEQRQRTRENFKNEFYEFD
jgi:hypothetical protein